MQFFGTRSQSELFENGLEAEVALIKNEIYATNQRLQVIRECKTKDTKPWTNQFDISDVHLMHSVSNYSNLYSSASSVSNLMSPGKSVLGRGGGRDVDEEDRNDAVRPRKVSDLRVETEAEWVSPVDASKRRWTVAKSRKMFGNDGENENPFGKCPDSSFELNSSVVSLDFGLISPKRNWSSPPQRIERAQNREWSPHRVIDRPNPENSPGNWISLKESRQVHHHYNRQTLQQSPPIHDTKHVPVQSYAQCQSEEPRSSSQTTYIMPEKISVAVPSRVEDQPTRKTSVLMDYVPDRRGGGDGVQSKKRSASTADLIPGSFPVADKDKVKRVVEPGGRIVKISLLEDYQVQTFGKGIDKNVDDLDKNNAGGEPPPKMKKSSLKLKENTKLKPLKTKTAKLMTSPEKKLESGSNDGKFRMGSNEKEKEKKEEKAKKSDENHPNENKCFNNFAIDTKQMITDLEVILKDTKPIEQIDKEKTNNTEPKSKLPGLTKVAEDLDAVVLPEKKKRNIDTKRVHEFIKSQKQKRVEMMKADKKTKIEEREAIKKNLEELRARTLKLAAQSKKKKQAKKTIKVVDPGTEEDVTISLGLKQVKPKVSYNESVLNLKKKTPRVDPPPIKPEQQEGPDHLIREEEKAVIETEEKQREEKDQKEATNSHAKRETKSTSAIAEKHNDLNATLKKLAEALNMRMPERRSAPPNSFKSKSMKDASTRMTRDEGVNMNAAKPQEKRQMITIDFETIHALKEDIKKISENFKVLHEIIVEKTDLSEGKDKNKVNNENKAKEEKKSREKIETQSAVDTRSESVFSIQCNDDSVPEWMKRMLPKPHPYNVYTAFRRKMNLDTSKSSVSLTSQESSSYADTVSNTVSKYDSECEPLSFPSDRLQPTINQIVQRISCKSSKTTFDTAEERYFSVKDSGSEFSSSILDSEKQGFLPDDGRQKPLSVQLSASRKNSETRSSQTSISVSSVITEITSKHLEMPSMNDSFRSKISPTNFDKDKENLSLIRPDVKLITNDLSEKKLNNHSQSTGGPVNSVSSKTSTIESHAREGLNNSEEKSNREPKSDSTITEIIDNLSENEKSHCIVKTTNKKFQNAVQRLEETQQIRRTYFQPEMLHLQFQAELTLLETFQQSLSHFLEAERLKTLSEVSKIVYEKSVNTEKMTEREDQAVQTSFLKESGISIRSKSETESVKTEIDMSETQGSMKSIKTVSIVGNDVEKEDEKEKSSEKKTSEIQESYSFEEDTESQSQEENKSCRGKSSTTPDLSNGHNGISFQMLDRMIKDEELRSEHQLALIRLREKTLNEKVKAELTFLEMKKRALKESGNDEEQSVSALKKKQRGILIKYQSEKEEIQRLKKMHKIASEERKIMIKQQKQIQQMQISTKDMLIKLKRKNLSPQKKSPLKPKVLKSDDSQEEIQEDIAIQMSDSILTESVGSVNDSSQHSLESDLEISSECNGSDRESDIIQRSQKTASVPGKSKKAIIMEPEKYTKKHHSVDELLIWSKKLEEKENELKELERKTVNSVAAAKNRLAKPLKNVKIAVKDRSTSPFQFPESFVSPQEKSSSINEIIETKNSSTISEDVPKSIYKVELSQKVDKIPSSIIEDIPSQFSKSGSRTLDYYSESFESPSSSEAPKTKAVALRSRDSLRSKGSCKSIPIKLLLSPRIQSPRRRNSSGSDDSQNFSHTETTSEQSDLETRIAALHEQLRKRKLEAERLRREQKKAQRERLKVKEQSLLKQIQAYDAYIQKKKQELEQEYESSSKTVSKPLIKQPKVAEKSSLKKQETLPLAEADKIKFYPKTTAKPTKEKDESTSSLKITHESDSEIQELIKESSETEKTTVSGEKSRSITEQIEGKIRKDVEEDIEESIDGEKSKTLSESKEPSSVIEADTSLNEILETIKESTLSTESLPEPEIGDEKSASDSEDRSTSIKTTVHSPEKEDTDIISSKEKSEVIDEVETKDTKPLSDNTYLSDSFESDFEEKTSTKGTKTQKVSEVSEVMTHLSGDVTRTTKSEDEKVKKETKMEEVENDGEPDKKLEIEERMKEVEEITINESSSIKSMVSEEVSRLTETDGNKMANIEIITDSIIFDLLSESLKMFSEREVKIQKKTKEKLESDREVLASILANKIIAETIDDMLKVYNRKTSEQVNEVIEREESVEEEPISPDKITSDIRKRICEIISHAGGIKDQKRPQEMMVTTYDVTPRDTSPEEGDVTEGEKREEFIRSLTSTPKKSNSVEVFSQSEPVHQDNKNDAFGQEWFDDDFGLSRTRREAEQLRLQQLQIEQEIQQLQAQQEQIPYYYIREIPNKPPPPYTPPGKSYSEIPTSESDVDKVTSHAVEILTAELNKGRSLRDVEPPREYFGEKPTSEHVKTYKTFLFDLAKHLIQEVVTIQDKRKEKVLPWDKVREPLSAYRYNSIERTTKDLNEYVRKRVLGLFGFRAKVGRESLMMRCFKKKRDHVDEILVFEAQEEEAQWTRFDEDQVAVKNEVALAILDDLLLESARLVNFIFNKKMKRFQ